MNELVHMFMLLELECFANAVPESEPTYLPTPSRTLQVKYLGYERYKLIVQVTLGQKKGQAMRLVSRSLWDTSTDNFATTYYENDSLYCVCQCYGLYIE